MSEPAVQALPFDVRFELEDWKLFWALVEVVDENAPGLGELRTRVAAAARERFTTAADIAQAPAVQGMRRLFRAAGCDPTRYRPASEALLRRLVKGAELPSIHPLVDVNNCLSAAMAVPCCVMREGSFGSRLVMRSGRAGESYTSLRGPFNLEGRPVLVDENGPLDTPITGNERVMVRPDTRSAWLVAYIPAGTVDHDKAWNALASYQEPAGVRARRYG
jgi:DNA/RNA-binding domain of Phe-tRNA-synthetase-like protein